MRTEVGGEVDSHRSTNIATVKSRACRELKKKQIPERRSSSRS